MENLESNVVLEDNELVIPSATDDSEFKEFVVRMKRVLIVDVIVQAQSEDHAKRKVLHRKGRQGDTEDGGFLHPSTWEVYEV